ncbi:MAG: hypothetical protein ACKOQ6_11930 [Bacteroidota bacterium]
MSDALYTTENDGSKGKKNAKDGALTATKEETQLDRLRGIVKQKVERKPVLIPVPERPGVSVKISPNITQSQMKNWRKSAGEDSRNGLDATKFACLVIGHTTIGICMDNEEITDENGNFLNFAHPAILEMTETTKPVPDAVRALFGVDPHVESAALAILDAAGYSDTVAAVDPTKESSTN